MIMRWEVNFYHPTSSQLPSIPASHTEFCSKAKWSLHPETCESHMQGSSRG